MNSLNHIQQLNREAAIKECQDMHKPFTPFDPAEIAGHSPLPLPNLDDISDNWWQVDELRVTEHGNPINDELTLTLNTLHTYMVETSRREPRTGYAVTQRVRQDTLDLYVGVFVPAA